MTLAKELAEKAVWDASGECELAFSMLCGNGSRFYVVIHTHSDGGYEYTYADENYHEIDGGIYDGIEDDSALVELIESILAELAADENICVEYLVYEELSELIEN